MALHRVLNSLQQVRLSLSIPERSELQLSRWVHLPDTSLQSSDIKHITSNNVCTRVCVCDEWIGYVIHNDLRTCRPRPVHVHVMFTWSVRYDRCRIIRPTCARRLLSENKASGILCLPWVNTLRITDMFNNAHQRECVTLLAIPNATLYMYLLYWFSDIDECATTPSVCGKDAINCTNTVGGYECHCKNDQTTYREKCVSGDFILKY